jgi:hypothetical protein
MVIKKCTQIYGCHGGAQMDGLQVIPDPPDRSAFNGGGGGSGMRHFSLADPVPTCHPSIAPDPPSPFLHSSSTSAPLIPLSFRP